MLAFFLKKRRLWLVARRLNIKSFDFSTRGGWQNDTIVQEEFVGLYDYYLKLAGFPQVSFHPKDWATIADNVGNIICKFRTIQDSDLTKGSKDNLKEILYAIRDYVFASRYEFDGKLVYIDKYGRQS
jgi:hypothetical protein